MSRDHYPEAIVNEEITAMDNFSIKFQLPSGEVSELGITATELISTLIESHAEGVFPMAVTNIQFESKSQCGKTVTTRILNNDEFPALTEIS